MALSRGTGLKREGPHGTAPGKAWLLLCSASSHPLGEHSESDAGGPRGRIVGMGVSSDSPGS